MINALLSAYDNLANGARIGLWGIEFNSYRTPKYIADAMRNILQRQTHHTFQSFVGEFLTALQKWYAYKVVVLDTKMRFLSLLVAVAALRFSNGQSWSQETDENFKRFCLLQENGFFVDSTGSCFQVCLTMNTRDQNWLQKGLKVHALYVLHLAVGETTY